MEEKRITPLKAIRLKCLDCSCGSPKEVKLCTVEGCPLYPYRFGKNPKRLGIGGNGRFGAEKVNSESHLPESAQPGG